MISRRKILSRPRNVSLDNNNSSLYAINYNSCDEEEDVWYSKEKLFKDHILEIYNKWCNIDDEIWAKIIVLERNRRIAKAYARVPILTINGSANGFDGYHIGLNGFGNPMRDSKTEMAKQSIGDGVKIRMDSSGNILIKRLSKSSVYIKGWHHHKDHAKMSNSYVLRSSSLEMNRTTCLFDMNQFQACMTIELRRAAPDRAKLESMCLCFISFVKDEHDPLELPAWLMVINVVALDMLKSRFQVSPRQQSVPNIVLALEQQRHSSPREEDPYSLPGNNSSSSESHNSGQYGGSVGQLPHYKVKSKDYHFEPRPPKLPPRDFELKTKGTFFSKNLKHTAAESEPTLFNSSYKHLNDDPYYSGFIARVPNYTRQPAQFKNKHFGRDATSKEMIPSGKHYESPARKVSSSKGFLNSVLKSNQAQTHLDDKSFYGSQVEYDPYTLGDRPGGVADHVPSTYDVIGMQSEYEKMARWRRKSRVPRWVASCARDNGARS